MKHKFFGIFLIIITTLFFVFFTNKGKLYILKANYCLKKNEISCAQSSFEKAFALGFNSPLERDKYVISIINSPFTLEAQEKVLKFLEIDVNDSARIKLEYFLQDLRKEIIRKYSGNYIKQAPYSQKILRWGKMPITYNISREDNVPDYYEKEIDDAFTEWEKALEHLILFEKTERNANVAIELNIGDVFWVRLSSIFILNLSLKYSS